MLLTLNELKFFKTRRNICFWETLIHSPRERDCSMHPDKWMLFSFTFPPMFILQIPFLLASWILRIHSYAALATNRCSLSGGVVNKFFCKKYPII